MAHQHHFRTLTEKPYGYVGYCDHCRTYNIAYKNFLLCLPEAEFEWFRQLILGQQVFQCFQTTHGKQVYMKTPMSNFFLLFSHDELTELLDMLNEVNLIIEANLILSNLN
jgi:hypothetical protein